VVVGFPHLPFALPCHVLTNAKPAVCCSVFLLNARISEDSTFSPPDPAADNLDRIMRELGLFWLSVKWRSGVLR